jgi:hypothetical protein
MIENFIYLVKNYRPFEYAKIPIIFIFSKRIFFKTIIHKLLLANFFIDVFKINSIQ